jgi:PiT family inorganic phosphate transporter
MLTLVVCIIVLALVFDYINGFHDAANSIATVVSDRGHDAEGGRWRWRPFFNFVRSSSSTRASRRQ